MTGLPWRPIASVGKSTFKERWAKRTLVQKFDFVTWCIIGGAWAGVVVALVVSVVLENHRVAGLSPAEREAERTAENIKTANLRSRTEDAFKAAKGERRRREELRASEEASKELEAIILAQQRAKVGKCVEERKKLLPGLWPSGEAAARIEADCADREAKRAEGGEQ